MHFDFVIYARHSVTFLTAGVRTLTHWAREAWARRRRVAAPARALAVVPGRFAAFWDTAAEMEARERMATGANVGAIDVAAWRAEADAVDAVRPRAAAMLRSAAQAVETLRRMMRDLEEARDSAFDRLNRERRAFAVERYQWERSAITREEWRG